MLIAATIVNNLVVAEAEAIEESLAKSRIYWAARGHMDYALSRVREDGVCNFNELLGRGTCSANDGADFPVGQQPDDGSRALSAPLDNRADSLRTYLRELYNKGEARDWDYDEYDQIADSDRYRLSIQHTVKVAEEGSTVDGYLRVTMELTGVGSIESLQGLPNRVRPVEFDVCLGAPRGQTTTNCNEASGPSPSTQISNFTAEQAQKEIFVFRVRRPPNQ